MRAFERGAEALRHPARPDRQGQKYTGGRAAQERSEQLDRARIGPVEIVKDEYERRRPREVLEEQAHGAVAAIALLLDGHLMSVSEPGERREDLRELCPDLAVEDGELCGLQACHVRVQGVDEDGERHVTLEFRRSTSQSEVPARVGASDELLEQSGLADARFTHHLDGARVPMVEPVQGALEHGELLITTDEVL
jgi:hypothetical protein